MNIFFLFIFVSNVYSFDMSFEHHNIVVYNSKGMNCANYYHIPSITFVSSQIYSGGICHKGFFGEYPMKDMYFYVKQTCGKNKLHQMNGCNEDCSSCTSSSSELHIYKKGPIACLYDFRRNITQSFAIEKTSQDSNVIIPKCLSLEETTLLHRQPITFEMFFYIIAPFGVVAIMVPIVSIYRKKQYTHIIDSEA